MKSRSDGEWGSEAGTFSSLSFLVALVNKVLNIRRQICVLENAVLPVLTVDSV